MDQTFDRFCVTYQIRVNDDRGIDAHARDICLEQTVEVPPAVIPDSHEPEGLLGRIERIEPLRGDDSRYLVDISYRSDLAAASLPQLLNVLYGNISLKNNIRIIDLKLPDSLRRQFGGPAYGVDGIRGLIGVHGRPLACTALKPMGLPVADLARLAGAYAAGGVDLIKDDHGLSDQPFHPFAERVARCQEAIDRACAQTGRTSLYFPMVSGGLDRIEEQLAAAARAGVRGVMVGPMLSGLDTVRHIARHHGLAVMAHPALTGTCFHDRDHGIAPAVLLGTLFRLAGADISIYPHAGGRFHFSEQECRDIATALRRDEGNLSPALPCPAGGMTLARVPELTRFYGPEMVLLIGGDILRQPDIADATRRFMDALRACGEERLSTPLSETASACEWRSGQGPDDRLQSLLPFADWRWQGRTPQAYKGDDAIDFRGVTRLELTGRFGERTSFDLRYFEIEPGGFSSREKHVHEHVIIAVRGRGVLWRETETVELKAHDIAYIAPLEPHQLRNEGDEPFGFYCIVDHDRDRPQKV